jgi:hypothetical protein
MPYEEFLTLRADKLLAKLFDLVTQGCGFFEIEVSGVVEHLLFETDHLLFKLALTEDLTAVFTFAFCDTALFTPTRGGIACAFHDIHHVSFDTGGDNVMRTIVLHLRFATTVRYVDRSSHGIRDFIAVQYGFAIQVSRSTTDGLNQGSLLCQHRVWPQARPQACRVLHVTG